MQDSSDHVSDCSACR